MCLSFCLTVHLSIPMTPLVGEGLDGLRADGVRANGRVLSYDTGPCVGESGCVG